MFSKKKIYKNLPLIIFTIAVFYIVLNFFLESFRESTRYMISSSHPLATQAGEKILKRNGNAIDAAITTQMVLNVVEPQSSGIGGGGFLLYYDKKNKHIEVYDGREVAPKKAQQDLFLRVDGNPLNHSEAILGGKSVGVPGLLAMLNLAHKDHSTFSLKELFQPAIDLAKNGFPVSSRLSEQITNDKLLRKTETSKRFFYDKDNSAKKTEEIIYNKNFSETLEYISVEGVEGFYHGKIAKKIIQKIHKSKINPGEMELSDLKNYKAKKRNVICKQYRIVWKVCGMPPPSSGGIAILQALGILENFDMHNYKGQTDKIIHLLSETLRLIFEDRNKYIGDPDFVKVPMENLLNPFYLKERSQLIKLDQKMEKTFPMSFEDSQDISFSEMASNEKDSTSHISIIDQEGNAVAFTSSIESAFGSRFMGEGFLLNNQLTDFSFIPNKNGIKVANKVEPNKRPMSSMSPTLVFKNNSLYLILGSPGGQNIISYVLKTLIYIIDFDMKIVKAIDAPNFAIRNQEMFIEENRLDDLTIRRLEDLGHDIVYKKMKSGLNVIKIKNGKIYGEADSRRQGLALGN